MENLFPKESPYEIINYSLSSLAFKIIKEMAVMNNYLEKKLDKINKEKKIFSNTNISYYNDKNKLDNFAFNI